MRAGRWHGVAVAGKVPATLEGHRMVDASWLPDPSGTHELRYWNGTAWTEHVSDQGTTGIDAPTRELPLPGEAPPPPPPPRPGDTNVLYYGSTRRRVRGDPTAGRAAAPAGGGGKPSWKDRLKQVADQGKAVAEQGKAKLAEQSAKRTEQWANDPSTLWSGESKGGATGAAGVAKARYRITKPTASGSRAACSAPAPRACRCGRSGTWTSARPSGSAARTSATSCSAWTTRRTASSSTTFNLTGTPEAGRRPAARWSSTTSRARTRCTTCWRRWSARPGTRRRSSGSRSTCTT